MQRFLLSAILFFLVLIAFSFFFFLYEARFFGTRASVARVDISADNSYVFSNPLKALSDGKEKIRVSVFVLNSQGLGVFGKKVSLTPNAQVVVDPVQPTTDSTGKAMFDYMSTVPGEYYLDVSVDEITLPQKVRLSFTQE